MKAQLNVMTQGIQGKKRHIKEQGQVCCFIDDDDSNMLTDASVIVVDAFMGKGTIGDTAYKRRSFCVVTIKHDGKEWSGSISALANALKLHDE